MPQIKSQEKRVRTNNKRNLAVSAKKAEVRTFVKKVTTAIEANDKAAAIEAFNVASSKLEKAAGKGIYHRNFVARQKSRMMNKINHMA